MTETRTCPDCGRQFTDAEMAAEAIAGLHASMAALSTKMRTDATFGRMTGLGDEQAMDRLDVAAMEVHPSAIDDVHPAADASSLPGSAVGGTHGRSPVSDVDVDEDVDSWTGERCWRCTLEADER
jgi:hypothetical protein